MTAAQTKFSRRGRFLSRPSLFPLLGLPSRTFVSLPSALNKQVIVVVVVYLYLSHAHHESRRHGHASASAKEEYHRERVATGRASPPAFETIQGLLALMRLSDWLECCAPNTYLNTSAPPSLTWHVQLTGFLGCGDNQMQ